MCLYIRSAIPKARLHLAFSFFCIFIALLATPVFGQQPQVLLGDTRVESSLDKNPGGTAEAFPVQAATTGQVNSLSVYLDRSNAASTVSVGVYSNSNGHPQALLSSGVIPNTVAGQWNSVVMSPLSVTRGTTYWLALLGVNGAVQFRDRNGRCQSEVAGQTHLSSLPASWVAGSRWPTCIVSMFETGSITGGGSTPTAGVSVSPHAITLQAGQQQQFSAVVNGLNNPVVSWTASGGTISRSGLYAAPSTAGTFTVTANVAASGRRSSAAVESASAIVTVTQSSPAPPPTVTRISISPTAASLTTGAQQQFSVTVSGAANTGVVWSASSGTIAANGLYTAPAKAGTYTITAVSSADSTKSASALVVVSAPQAVAVNISPTNASVGEANQLQFTATVSGVSNTAVTWAVTRGSGTITQSGLYTAPGTAESDTITATSQADSTKSVSASITVVAAHSVSLSWGASSSTDVAFYKVYRGTVSGGPYSVLTSNLKATTYKDSTVQSGNSYYYVTSTVDTAGVESIFSNEFRSVIPSP
jgi:hypothetical protein